MDRDLTYISSENTDDHSVGMRNAYIEEDCATETFRYLNITAMLANFIKLCWRWDGRRRELRLREGGNTASQQKHTERWHSYGCALDCQ